MHIEGVNNISGLTDALQAAEEDEAGPPAPLSGNELSREQVQQLAQEGLAN